MSLVGLGLLEHGVCPMQMVQHPQHPIALVEPGGEKRMLETCVLTSFVPASPTFLSPPTPTPTSPLHADHLHQKTQGRWGPRAWGHPRLEICELPLKSSYCDRYAHKSEPVAESEPPGTPFKMQIPEPCSSLPLDTWIQEPRACICEARLA